MIIEHIYIQGFWNEYSLDWELQPDVNLLSGINGSGKTTLFDTLYSLLSKGALYPFLENKIQSVRIQLSDGYHLSSDRNPQGRETHYFHQGQSITKEEFTRACLLMAISTFDTRIPQEEDFKRMLLMPNIRTELDYNLNQAFNAYYKYLAYISKLVETAVSEQKPNAMLSPYYDNKNLFIKTVNELFTSTQKEWDENGSEILFRLKGKNMQLKPQELSSGEKQLLMILISSLVSSVFENITFWDEPEISLHIDWQRVLIRKARELNPKGQFIIATHSPSLIYEGWEGCIVNMEDLLK